MLNCLIKSPFTFIYPICISLNSSSIFSGSKKILCLIYNKRERNLKKRSRERMGEWKLSKEEFERCKKEAVEKTVEKFFPDIEGKEKIGLV